MKLWIYASVTEHDPHEREKLLVELNRWDILPVFRGDTVEFRYYGERETVIELSEEAEKHIFHSVHVWGG